MLVPLCSNPQKKIWAAFAAAMLACFFFNGFSCCLYSESSLFSHYVAPVDSSSLLLSSFPSSVYVEPTKRHKNQEKEEESPKAPFSSLLSTAIYPHLTQQSSDLAKTPVAVYLSWASDPCRSMVVYWITKNTMSEVKASTTSADSLEKSAEPHALSVYTLQSTTSIKIPFIESSFIQTSSNILDVGFPSFQSHQNTLVWEKWREKHLAITRSFPENNPYLLHSVLLHDLTPATSYIFHIENTNIHHAFTTAPETLDKPINFVIGGDCGAQLQSFQNTNRQAALQSPLFAVLGGDLAYATPSALYELEDCTKWINWLIGWYRDMQCYDVAQSPYSRLIPLIVAIGNHEVKGRAGQSEQQAPFFYTLFRTPYLEKSFYTLRFSDYLSLYILDSGHAASVQGEQATWLSQKMKQDVLVSHKIATYHVPAYPSVRYYNNTLSLQVRKYWIPIFDKEQLHMAFENHDHSYKRTFPLKDHKIHLQGVTYIGDGSWGVKDRFPKKANKTTYLAKTAKAKQFCSVILSKNRRYVVAISSDGKQIDSYMEGVMEEVTTPIMATPAPLLKKNP